VSTDRRHPFLGQARDSGTPALADFLGVETFDGFHQRLG
jgi:hypothetical protein